jgi:hypothetical protein
MVSSSPLFFSFSLILYPPPFLASSEAKPVSFETLFASLEVLSSPKSCNISSSSATPPLIAICSRFKLTSLSNRFMAHLRCPLSPQIHPSALHALMCVQHVPASRSYSRVRVLHAPTREALISPLHRHPSLTKLVFWFLFRFVVLYDYFDDPVAGFWAFLSAF